jgi:hypothetical protein
MGVVELDKKFGFLRSHPSPITLFLKNGSTPLISKYQQKDGHLYSRSNSISLMS